MHPVRLILYVTHSPALENLGLSLYTFFITIICCLTTQITDTLTVHQAHVQNGTFHVKFLTDGRSPV